MEGVGRISLALATLTEDPGEEDRIDEGNLFLFKPHPIMTKFPSQLHIYPRIYFLQSISYFSPALPNDYKNSI